MKVRYRASSNFRLDFWESSRVFESYAENKSVPSRVHQRRLLDHRYMHASGVQATCATKLFYLHTQLLNASPYAVDNRLQRSIADHIHVFKWFQSAIQHVPIALKLVILIKIKKLKILVFNRHENTHFIDIVKLELALLIPTYYQW